MRRWIWVGLCAGLAGCGSTGSKVLQDFGVQERPEDYVSGADRVMTKLPDVAKVEIDRLNALSAGLHERVWLADAPEEIKAMLDEI